MSTKPSDISVDQLIQTYDLMPHPEGGDAWKRLSLRNRRLHSENIGLEPGKSHSSDIWDEFNADHEA